MASYDTGGMNIMSVANVTGENIFSLVKFNFWCQIFGHGWTNAHEVRLYLNLSQLQCHPDARDATLVPAS